MLESLGARVMRNTFGQIPAMVPLLPELLA